MHEAIVPWDETEKPAYIVEIVVVDIEVDFLEVREKLLRLWQIFKRRFKCYGDVFALWKPYLLDKAKVKVSHGWLCTWQQNFERWL